MWDFNHKESWALKKWCFQIVVLEKMIESPLDSKEIKLVNPKGNQPWIITGMTDTETEAPIFWPHDTKSQFIWKDPDTGKDWGQEEKGATEDKMVEWHHWLNGHVSVSEVTQSCLTLCNPMDWSLPGSSVHGVLQARILEWVAIFFSRGTSGPRDRTRVSHFMGRFFTI